MSTLGPSLRPSATCGRFPRCSVARPSSILTSSSRSRPRPWWAPPVRDATSTPSTCGRNRAGTRGPWSWATRSTSAAARRSPRAARCERRVTGPASSTWPSTRSAGHSGRPAPRWTTWCAGGRSPCTVHNRIARTAKGRRRSRRAIRPRSAAASAAWPDPSSWSRSRWRRSREQAPGSSGSGPTRPTHSTRPDTESRNRADPLQHVVQVGAERRVGADDFLQLPRGDPLANGDGEEVDHLLGPRTQQVRAENLITLLVDEHLEARRRLAHPPRVEPSRRVLVVHLEASAGLAGGILAEPDRGQWRDREHGGGDALVVRRALVALQQIGGEHADVVIGLRRQRRPVRGRIATGVDGRIRDALEELVDGNPALLSLHAAGVEVEGIELGNAAGPVHGQIGLEALLHALLGAAHDEPFPDCVDAPHVDAHLDLDPQLA